MYVYIQVCVSESTSGQHGSDSIMQQPMPCDMQVVSAVLNEKKVYITGLAKDKVAKYDVSRQIQVYLLDEGKWSTVPEVPLSKDRKFKPANFPHAPNYNAPAAVINGRITLIGGRDAKTDAITNILSTWFEEKRQFIQVVDCMPTRRLESGVCYHEGLLLVAGGVEEETQKGKEEEEEGTVLNSVDVYNFSTKKWSTPKALELPRALRSPQVVIHKEKVYLVGGATKYPAKPDLGNPEAWTASWSDIVTAIEKPSEQLENVWSPIKAPPTLRPTVVSCGNSLLSVGGCKDETCCRAQKAIYKFVDRKADEPWIKVGNMSLGRCRHGVVPLGSYGQTLFVAGGYVWNDSTGEETNEKSSSVEIVAL